MRVKCDYQVAEPSSNAIRRHLPKRDECQNDSGIADQVRDEQEHVVRLEAAGELRVRLGVGHGYLASEKNEIQ